MCVGGADYGHPRDLRYRQQLASKFLFVGVYPVHPNFMEVLCGSPQCNSLRNGLSTSFETLWWRHESGVSHGNDFHHGSTKKNRWERFEKLSTPVQHANPGWAKHFVS